MAKELQKAYREYNRQYFKGALPNVPVRWSKQIGLTSGRGDAGFFIGTSDEKGDWVILVSHDLKTLEYYWRMTLLHEMAHVSVRNDPKERACTENGDNLEPMGHSKVWRIEMRRLAAAGAFDGLW